MKTIWKFQLGLGGKKVITMPMSAKIVSVQTQNEECGCMWAIVESLKPDENRTFLTILTGEEIPAETSTYKYDYIGTFQIRQFVFHVFEQILK